MRTARTVCVVWAALLGWIPLGLGQGTLDPPSRAFDEAGQPQAVMKTLDQVEPRAPIYELPYSITNEGSYYLVSSLMGSPSSNGIVVEVGNVHLDLNGFGLYGVSNSLNGILLAATLSNEAHNVSIYNGMIGEWGRFAINGTNSSDCEVSRVKLYGNRDGGIALGFRARVKECNVDDCGDIGISVSDGGTVTDCKVFNEKVGIQAANACSVTECMAAGSVENGIVAGDGSRVRECQVIWNASNGIVVAGGCLVLNNNCGGTGWPRMPAPASSLWAAGTASRTTTCLRIMPESGLRRAGIASSTTTPRTTRSASWTQRTATWSSATVSPAAARTM